MADKYLRCPSCNRKTSGIEDYIHIGNGVDVVKTCRKCRRTILNYQKRNPKPYVKRISMRKKLILCHEVFKAIDPNILKKIAAENKELEIVLKKHIDNDV